jgi:argininosuccinate lyase
MKAAAGEGYATATDLADWLVRTLKMPFRDAHHVTGRIVGLASKQGVALHELPLKAMQEVEPKITADALRVLSVEASVKSRTSYGGTAPKNVLSQAKAWPSGWKKSENKPEEKISLQFLGLPWLIGTRQSEAIFVWCGAHWGFRRDQ